MAGVDIQADAAVGVHFPQGDFADFKAFADFSDVFGQQVLDGFRSVGGVGFAP